MPTPDRGPIKTHMKNGLVVARLEVGTCVYITQGPPIEVQLLEPDARYVWCPAEEVQKAAQFASMQSKRSDDGGQQRRYGAELDAL